ncbi:hypothetical protein PGQ11_009568 [Apiospora arundinis]|uniref:Uncharacterized protein n=1 Tax=Apiospora arundinis TaxID=335852 RepID=A0ABR2IK80_9PEZI
MLSSLWKYVWAERQTRNYREAFLSVVAFVSLLMAGVAFWPANTAASDGYKSRLLAEWSARKEFLSNCEEHNWPSPSCDMAKGIQLEPPPNFDRSEWKRYHIRNWSTPHLQWVDDNVAKTHDVSSNTLVMLLWQNVQSQHQRMPYIILVIRPISESAPSRPSRPSFQWSLHFCTRIAFHPHVDSGFESITPERFEKPIAVYIFRNTENQIRLYPCPFLSNIKIWSDSAVSKVDSSQQSLMHDCIRKASAHLLKHRLYANFFNMSRRFMSYALETDSGNRVASYLLKGL